MKHTQQAYCKDCVEDLFSELYKAAKTPRGKVEALEFALGQIEVELQARKEEIA